MIRQSKRKTRGPEAVSLQLVLLGDTNVGKTALLSTYLNGNYVHPAPTQGFDKFIAHVQAQLHGRNYDVTLSVLDTSALFEAKPIRSLIYPDTTCFIICYAVNDKRSLDNVVNWWLPEIKSSGSTAPWILCGTKTDIKSTVSRKDVQKVKTSHGASTIVECSALRNQGVKAVFGQAIHLALTPKNNVRAILFGKKKPVVPAMEEVGQSVDVSKFTDKAFYEALQSDAKLPWQRSKLMVVGEGCAGKTATIRSLLVKAFDPNWVSTVGVSLESVKTCNNNIWAPTDNAHHAVHLANRLATGAFIKDSGQDFDDIKLSEPKLVSKPEPELAQEYDMSKMIEASQQPESISIAIWDYGGQMVFRTLHHLFLTQYGVYLLVFDMRQPDFQSLLFWYNSITLHAPAAPVIFVGTFQDQLLTAEVLLLQQELATQFPKMEHSVSISNKTGSGLPGLRQLIEKITKAQEFVYTRVNIRWMRCLDLLLDEEQRLSWFSYDSFKQVVRSFGMTSNSELDEMLQLFHELGAVLHFRTTERLKDIIITNPQWVISSICKVIRDPKLHSLNEQDMKTHGLFDDMQLLFNRGVATRSLLDYLWQEDEVDYLIDLMQHLLLMGKWQSEDTEASYLIPTMVYNTIPIQPFSEGYVFTLHFNFLPTGVFERIVCLSVDYCSSLSQHVPKPTLGQVEGMFWFSRDTPVHVNIQNVNCIQCVFGKAESASFLVNLLETMLRKLNQEVFKFRLAWETKVVDGDLEVDYQTAKEQKLWPWTATEVALEDTALDSFLGMM